MSTTLTPSADTHSPEEDGAAIPQRHVALAAAVRQLRGDEKGVVSVHGITLLPDQKTCLQSLRAQTDGTRTQMLRTLSVALGEGIVIDDDPVTDHIDDLAGRYARVLRGEGRWGLERAIVNALRLPADADEQSVYESLMRLSPEERDRAIGAISDAAFHMGPALPEIRHDEETRWERGERERGAAVKMS